MIKQDAVDEISARLEAGERFSGADLESCSTLDVLRLGMLADVARRRAGRHVTYLRVHEVTPGEAGADLRVPSATEEVRISDLPTSYQEACALIRRVRSAVPDMCVVTGFSWADLENRATHGWDVISDLLPGLRHAGLDDVAELPVDLVDDLPRAILAGRGGGLHMGRLTVDRPLGESRLAVLRRARATIETEGGIERLAPLPTHPPADVPTTGYDDLRTIALARLSLSHLGGSAQAVRIEVNWRVYGPKLAQVALVFGADHLDAVSAAPDGELGPRRATIADLERNIRAAGFEPRGRSASDV